jgi:hypothetical protein
MTSLLVHMCCYTDIVEADLARDIAPWDDDDHDDQTMLHNVQPEDVLYAVYYRHFKSDERGVKLLHDRGLISYDEDENVKTNGKHQQLTIANVYILCNMCMAILYFEVSARLVDIY